TPTNTLSFTIGTAAAETVTISARPSTVPATGGTVEVNAVVRGTNGQGVGGIPVTFTTTSGTLTNTIAVTDANGVATVGLTTNTEASVSAASGSKTTATAATVTVLGTPSVTLTCTGSGTGTTTCTQTVDQPMTFTAARATGSTPLRGASFDFGDGNNTDLGTLSSSVTVTHTYRSSNPYTATLLATDINGQTTRSSVAVNITPIPARTPLTVNITAATPGTAQSTGAPVAFTATATAETGVLIESFTWDFGDGVVIQTSGGQTSHVYGASSNPAPNAVTFQAYTVTLTVRTVDGRTGTARTQVQVRLAAAP
ncbi:MAG: PKD domain-containing protein, partial [Vicinamibacterales bacterium]